MLKGHKIRSNPGVCNQENRASKKVLADKESFGIYRPVDKASVQALHDRLVVVREEIDDYLSKRRKSSSNINIQETMGVTLLQQRRMRREIYKGNIAGQYALRLVSDGVAELNNSDEEMMVEFDLDRFDWYSQHRRKMVGCFANNDGSNALAEEAETIGGILEEASINGINVAPPDHVTLFKYGHEGDRLDLSRLHQRDVVSIVRDHFEDSASRELRLGSLIVGTSYDKPLELPSAVAA